jgi:hypothetical protein
LPGQGVPGGGSANTEQRAYEIDPGTSKEIQIMVFDVPRMVTINTLISGNIPSTFSTFLRSAVRDEYAELSEYERVVELADSRTAKGEYIVDNEDAGFTYITKTSESKLKQYIEARKENTERIAYAAMSIYRNPARWTHVAHTGFYGQSIRSALLSASGDGGNRAIWEAALPEAGFYDVEVYIPMSAMLRPPGRGRRGSGRSEQGSSRQGGRGGPSFGDEGADYNYTIASPAGSDEIKFILSNISEGWNKIGSFYFPADTASIQLSNLSSGNRVIADAVKWVYKSE